jgi:hypothetical protein
VSDKHAVAELFDDAARSLAESYHADSHYRWLTLSRDIDARALRKVVGTAWQATGRSRPALKRGLEHERWGQHVGALAHLLCVGFFRRLGLEIESEPPLAGRSPDLCIGMGGEHALVEVRSLAGFGRRPWEDPVATAERRNVQPDPRLVSRRHERDRARRRAMDRAEAVAALNTSLATSVARALRDKADAYKEVCEHSGLPYVVCLYQDTDTQIAERVLDWAFGASSRGGQRDAGGGALHHAAQELAHLSGILVLGRLETGEDHVTLRGELILNPFADRTVPDWLRTSDVRQFATTDPDGLPAWDRKQTPVIEL